MRDNNKTTFAYTVTLLSPGHVRTRNYNLRFVSPASAAVVAVAVAGFRDRRNPIRTLPCAGRQTLDTFIRVFA